MANPWQVDELPPVPGDSNGDGVNVAAIWRGQMVMATYWFYWYGSPYWTLAVHKPTRADKAVRIEPSHWLRGVPPLPTSTEDE